MCVYTLGPATGCCSSGDQVPFKNLLLVIAGHLECERGEWGEEKKVPEQPKEGAKWSGADCVLLVLHPSLTSMIGSNQADSVTSFCEFHTKEQIMDMANGYFHDNILDTQRNIEKIMT